MDISILAISAFIVFFISSLGLLEATEIIVYELEMLQKEIKIYKRAKKIKKIREEKQKQEQEQKQTVDMFA